MSTYVPDTVLSTLHGLTWLIHTTPYEVDIIITSILLMGTLRLRKFQEQVLISKCWNLDLSISSPSLYRLQTCWCQKMLISEQNLSQEAVCFNRRARSQQIRPDSGIGVKRLIFRGCGASQSNKILRIFYRPVDTWIFIFLILWSSLLGKSPRNSEELSSCMELRRCACSMILQFHEPPVIVFLMTWRGKPNL